MSTLRVAWLYPDLLELYGDRGNIQILKHRCTELGIELIVSMISIGNEVNYVDYDLIFFGGGADRDQSILYHDLLQRKSELIEAIENNVVFILICGGYQLFGQYYLDSSGNKLEGLNIFDYYSCANDSRSVGYLCVEAQIDNNLVKLVGFENHGGHTYNVSSPIGKVTNGYGNNQLDKTEGFRYKNVFGTYMHGPLLSRNPELLDYVIKLMCNRKGIEVDFSIGNHEFSINAKKYILDEINRK